MDFTASTAEVIGRLAIAMLFGAMVGWERESKHRPAGLRTHMLVALGSAGFTLIALDFAASTPGSVGQVRFDPLRVIQGIVGGIGFLGAGAIIQARGHVFGLTTAAGLWVVAAVGVAAGCGRYSTATILAACTLVTLSMLRIIERRTKADSDDEDAITDDDTTPRAD